MHIAFDADDTLWHNEPVFSLTQDKVNSLLSAHVPSSELRDKLVQTERANLRLFGYGVKGFTLSMIETALEVSNNQIPSVVIRQILDAGKSMLEHPVELLPGVRELLGTLHGRRPLMLITKGDLFDQESKLARSGLSEFFDAVEIVSEKDPETYRDVLKRHQIAAERFVMIGNSVKSDILPVVNIGGNAIHVPYATTWVLDQVEHRGPEQEGYWEVSGLADVPGVLDKIAALGWSDSAT